jgi:hypothetical protein
MFQSVSVERTSELPDGQVAMIEFQPDGTVTYRVDRQHITEIGAEALQTLMVAARDAYHQAWDLPPVPSAALA